MAILASDEDAEMRIGTSAIVVLALLGGTFLLGVFTVQRMTISRLEASIEKKDTDYGALFNTASQYQKDLEFKDEEIGRARNSLNLERQIAAGREKELRMINDELKRDLALLNGESANENEDATCLRVRMSDRLIGMLGGAPEDNDGDQDSDRKTIPSR
ncbi:hypothetical protein VIBNISOn1_1840082 [Vibrio nigripulchritudo SOn1]|uniref:Uncharacterized protein n=1 Tax=Vibrio nigripulchritudo SOn1 TaxID=1238450 RepID=A0AAV2VPX4_9VIBR|nr:hypothetical protein [Vibrio nigripulchritudo]CCO46699.1 hypothetical protein VIBNISOn1_1840082 [Vibrio nigripulchritudo SOn1]